MPGRQLPTRSMEQSGLVRPEMQESVGTGSEIDRPGVESTSANGTSIDYRQLPLGVFRYRGRGESS